MNDDIAIDVRNLGKKYQLGEPQKSHQTFRDAIANSVKAPFHRIIHMNSNLSVNDFWVPKAVSFNVEHGKVVGIIMRKGAGKSTLLKILSRISHLSHEG